MDGHRGPATMSTSALVALVPERPGPGAVRRLAAIAGPVRVSAAEPYASAIAPGGAARAAPPPAAALVEVELREGARPDLGPVAEALGGDGLVALVERHERLRRGGPAGGPRFVSLFTRRAGMTREQFWAHWTSRHVPLVLASEPGFDVYVTGLVRDATGDVDGVVEQGFASEAALRAHHGTVHEKPAVVADAARFVGDTRSWIVAPAQAGAP